MTTASINLDDFAEELGARCLHTETVSLGTSTTLAQKKGDVVPPYAHMARKHLRWIAGDMPKQVRAPKSALEREISCRLDELPHMVPRGKFSQRVQHVGRIWPDW